MLEIQRFQIKRRHMQNFEHFRNVYRCAILAVLFIHCLQIGMTYAQSISNPKHLEKFVDELPDMPRIKAYRETEGMITPANLTIGMYQIKWKFHRDIPPTPVFAYGTSAKKASVPGPTIDAKAGLETYIRWENHLPQRHLFPLDYSLDIARPKYGGVPTVVHVHGGINEPESDGHSHGWFTSGFKEKGAMWSKRVYHYFNIQQPGNLWYHDHAMGLTRVNILAGLYGAYVIRDPILEEPLNLPSGHKYDRHLLISDRSFYRNGSIYFPSVGNNPHIHPQWQPEYFGDVIVVNGKAWPYLKVKRRKYRFRIVNSSNARFFRFALTAGLSFTQIGADSCYLEKPVKLQKILVAPSEQADVIIDFRKSPRKEVLLTNSAVYPFPSGDPVNSENSLVMKFVVDKKVHSQETSKIPQRNLIPTHRLKQEDAAQTRIITMFEYESAIGEPTHLLFNGLTFDSPATETPKAGTTELWHIINLTQDNHPLHVHLGAFQVISEQKLRDPDKLKACLEKSYSPEKCRVWNYVIGKPSAPSANEAGWKNVYKMKPAHITSFLTRFLNLNSEPYPFNVSADPGYAYHCHILDHEDNEMMRPLKILP
ncbi:hypothetical protein O6H91_06G035800 [Diphasiastrum complanatum]|uniref:Uncharacterized protein n=1 Tax=Diphasiastrum complanatum TaxID=34168 RepID=A0ACC2DCG4_DIPCM|nr:hypothetical protein O6H91_06G035800 [Diphasiastrum complanatum]